MMARSFATLRMTALVFLFVSSASAVSIQDWIKKGGYQRKRDTSKRTTVAAVRGVEEPGDVDPEARDFEGLKKVEQRKVPSERVEKFIQEGKLKKK